MTNTGALDNAVQGAFFMPTDEPGPPIPTPFDMSYLARSTFLAHAVPLTPTHRTLTALPSSTLPLNAFLFLPPPDMPVQIPADTLRPALPLDPNPPFKEHT